MTIYVELVTRKVNQKKIHFLYILILRSKCGLCDTTTLRLASREPFLFLPTELKGLLALCHKSGFLSQQTSEKNAHFFVFSPKSAYLCTRVLIHT